MIRHLHEWYPVVERMRPVVAWMVVSCVLALFLVWGMIVAHVVKREREGR